MTTAITWKYSNLRSYLYGKLITDYENATKIQNNFWQVKLQKCCLKLRITFYVEDRQIL